MTVSVRVIVGVFSVYLISLQSFASCTYNLSLPFCKLQTAVFCHLASLPHSTDLWSVALTVFFPEYSLHQPRNAVVDSDGSLDRVHLLDRGLLWFDIWFIGCPPGGRKLNSGHLLILWWLFWKYIWPNKMKKTRWMHSVKRVPCIAWRYFSLSIFYCYMQYIQKLHWVKQ